MRSLDPEQGEVREGRVRGELGMTEAYGWPGGERGVGVRVRGEWGIGRGRTKGE